MLPINAVSIAPDAHDWLANPRHPRILHVFDHTCNLINERGEVLSIVARQIGNGPFNLVVEEDVLFSDHLNLQSLSSVSPNQLNLGDLTINIDNAKLWSPRPDWEMLHARRDDILNQLMSLPITDYQVRGLDLGFATSAQPYSTTPSPQSLISALSTANLPFSLNAARKLAGLGQGLTPAGDDFILGAVLAVWIIYPLDVARVLALEVTDAAAPLTTSLSAAWLTSAGRGEAGILWHQFFEALISSNHESIQEMMDKILAVGETSGADALAGFIGLFKHIANSMSSEIS